MPNGKSDNPIMSPKFVLYVLNPAMTTPLTKVAVMHTMNRVLLAGKITKLMLSVLLEDALC
tara:strand:+ start:602 stop:784 length:183 start_codon:yes stop_codon:yes gene_type:complete